MLKNIIYAVLLGIGMAACLSQQEKEEADTAGAPAPEQQQATLDTPETIPQPAPATFAVEKAQVGKVKIGMPIGQMREHVAKGLILTDTMLTQEGMQSTAYLLRPEGQAKGLLVEQACDPTCKVWRISVLSSDYKTPKGLGVGSKYSELQQAYDISSVTFEEGNLVALAPAQGMSFILDTGQLEKNTLPQLTEATVPANTVIRKILIY